MRHCLEPAPSAPSWFLDPSGISINTALGSEELKGRGTQREEFSKLRTAVCVRRLGVLPRVWRVYSDAEHRVRRVRLFQGGEVISR